MLRYFFLLLLIIPKISKLQTSPTFCVDRVSERQILDLHLLHYTENITDSLPHTLPIFKENKWTIVGNKGLTFSPGSHHDWLKVSLYATRNCTKTIFINYPTIPELDIWLCQENDSILDHISLGLRKPFNVSHPSITSGFTYDINFEKGKIYTCYIHFKAYGQPHLSNVYLADSDHLYVENKDSLQYFLIIKTILSVIISLIFITYFFLRKSFLMYYTLFIISIILFIEGELGSFWYFIKYDKYEIIFLLKSWSNLGAILFGYIFFRKVLNTPHGTISSDKVFQYLLLLSCFITFIFTISRYHSVMIASLTAFILILMTYVGSIYILWICVLQIKKENVSAKYLFISHLISIVLVFIYISSPFLGLSVRYFNNFFIPYIIYTIQIVMFLMIITQRIVTILDERKTLIINHHIAQQEVSEALIQGQEIERNRIGRELHDHVGGSLALINKRKEIKHPDTKKLIQKSLKSVRNLSHGLVSPSFEYEDFQETITDLGAKYNTAERKVHIHFMDWETTENVKALLYCYRIVQELLQNAEKHSKATHIFIQFFGGNESRIIYEDNGIGANDELLQKGIGLQNISNRVKALNGEMTIDTSDKGVFIVIDQLENIFHH